MTNVPMRHRGPYEWAVMVAGCVLGGMNIGLGLTLVAGDPRRTNGASFNGIKDIAPIEAWGLVFILCGLAAWLCQFLQVFSVVAFAHAVSGVLCVAWALAFLSGLDNVNVSGTGVWAYLALGLLHWTVAVTAWRS